jgi:spermidine synthase
VSPALLAALLFASGLAALVHETLWVKQTALLVGVDVYAVTTVVSGFFAGLGLGSVALGAAADRSRRPLALYAALAAGTAGTAAAVTAALAGLAPAYAHLAAALGPGARGLPFVLVALPAFLMGGTLPAAVRAAAPPAGRLGGVSGLLYAANTAGGVLGTLLTVFVLVPRLGVRASGLAAAGIHATAALAAAVLAGRAGAVPAAPAPTSGRAPGLALALYAVVGAVALGYELVWIQAVIPLINTRAHAFAAVLAVYLGGLVVGSAAYARLADRSRRPWAAFGCLALGAGASALALFAALGPWLPRVQATTAALVLARTGSGEAATLARTLLPPLVLLLLPTVLLGAAFPAAARLVAGPQHVGRDVGAVAAVNTLGGIVGTCVVGFVAVPRLGLTRALAALSVAAVAVGGLAVVRGARRRGRAAAVLALVVAGAAAGGASLPGDHLARLLVALRGGTLVAHEESAGGTVAVVAEPFKDTHFRRLYIQGTSNSADNLMSRRYMRLQALLPLLVHHDEPRRAVVIGLGTGITCGALLAHPGLERRVCVELLPAVVRAVPLFEGNYGVAGDPRVEIRLADGRHDLLLRSERWDVVTLEPPPPITAGVVNLYSRDFYRLCRDRLAPHGLMAQWLPLSTQNDEDSRMLVRTFVDVFPHASVWSTELHEMLLLGSADPIVLDAARVAQRLGVPSVEAALAEVGVASAADLLATYVTDRAGLLEYAGDAPLVTDDRPRIEYASLPRPGEFARTLGDVYARRADPPLVGADDALVARVAATRERLLGFYQAALYWYGGQTAEMEPILQRVFEEEPDNPYYRWFVGR